GMTTVVSGITLVMRLCTQVADTSVQHYILFYIKQDDQMRTVVLGAFSQTCLRHLIMYYSDACSLFHSMHGPNDLTEQL
ncbi:hypothetical protein BaRGS_00020096, partial [Batillaria attramentaria]